jgi:hypothetical protein
MTNLIRDPEYWRRRAAQTRAKIRDVSYRKARVDLLKVAEEYDRLAERAEQWRKQDGSESEARR